MHLVINGFLAWSISSTDKTSAKPMNHDYDYFRGRVQDFERGGGSISLGFLKKVIRF